jgi:hypothetical protein
MTKVVAEGLSFEKADKKGRKRRVPEGITNADVHLKSEATQIQL